MEYTIETDRGRQVTLRKRLFYVPHFTNYMRFIFPQVIRTTKGQKKTLKKTLKDNINA